MSTSPIDSCCPSFLHTGIFNCPNENAQKNIYPPSFYPAPAITFCILAVLHIGVILLIIKNLIHHFQNRKNPGYQEYFIINLLLFFAVLGMFVYLLDGPIQLITGGPGIPVPIYIPLELVSVYFLHATFICASYTWLELIFIYKQLWEKKGVAKALKAFIAIDLTYICASAIFTIVVLNIDYFKWMKVVSLLCSVSTFINGVILAISCYTMAVYLSKIYDFDTTKLKKMRVIKIVTVIIGCCCLERVIYDLSSYLFPDWQLALNLNSYCEKDLYWSAFLFFMNLTANIFPFLFILSFFTGKNRKKSKRSVSDISQIDLFAEIDLSKSQDIPYSETENQTKTRDNSQEFANKATFYF